MFASGEYSYGKIIDSMINAELDTLPSREDKTLEAMNKIADRLEELVKIGRENMDALTAVNTVKIREMGRTIAEITTSNNEKVEELEKKVDLLAARVEELGRMVEVNNLSFGLYNPKRENIDRVMETRVMEAGVPNRNLSIFYES